jgi:ubiquinone/menaquinone biosynthesis C-methylase UbiE
MRRGVDRAVDYARTILLRMFGRPQGVLGRLGGVIMARVNRAAAADIIDLLDIEPGDKLLEVGFGPGVAIQLLAERVRAGYIGGIDPSPEMVEQATARNAQAIRRGLIDLRRAYAESLPFDDNTFHRALAVNSMQVWSNPLVGLQEMRRVMKPGARVALGFTIHSGQANEGLTDRVAAAGFTKARVVERGKWFCVLASKP